MESAFFIIPFIMSWGFVVVFQGIVFGLTTVVMSYLKSNNQVDKRKSALFAAWLQVGLLVCTVIVLFNELWSGAYLLFTLLLAPILLAASVSIYQRYMVGHVIVALINSFSSCFLLIIWVLEEAFSDLTF